MTRRLGCDFADHDQAVTEHQLGMLDAAALPFDLETHLKAERAAEPVDGRRSVVVEDCGRDPRPSGSGRSRFPVAHRILEGV